MSSVRQMTGAAIALSMAFYLVGAIPCAAAQLFGRVVVGGSPVADSTVTLWQAGMGAPQKVAETHSGGDGAFVFSNLQANENTIRYIVASGGHRANDGGNPALVLLALLDSKSPDQVIVNEFTTVASAFTAAQFIQSEAISGNALGLRIAAMNVPNFVDLRTGSWGHTIVDGLNSWRSTSLANFDTLASLITYAATAASDDWRGRFFSAATPEGGKTPSNTLEAIAGIARQSWAHPKELFALFDEAYPQPKDGSPRAAPFAPYLAYEPPDFALMLCFWGGGLEAAGRLQIDADGNAWIGNNWMPGSQSNVANNIPGHVAKLAPDGTALSPAITGFTGAGMDGLGWGGAVTLHDVWAPGLNGKILVMDFDGHPIASEHDFPFHEKLGGLMGTGVAANGDVWIADGSNNQLLFFPGGRVKEGRIVKAPGLKSPFDVVIDEQNRVWVSNSQGDTVVRFPANNPNDVQTFRVGLSPRGLALDSKNNVWISSLFSPDIPNMPKVPDGVSIMEQFRIMFQALLADIQSGRLKSTGFMSMIRPDGTQPEPNVFNGNGALSLPWGVNIDGNDDVWTTNDLQNGVVYMAGDNTKGHAAGTKTGDVLHVFFNGTLQTLTDVSIDAAGNLWAADNWNDLPIATGAAHNFVRSTWGGGVGVTVIYGVASPVKPPKMGAVRRY